MDRLLEVEQRLEARVRAAEAEAHRSVESARTAAERLARAASALEDERMLLLRHRELYVAFEPHQQKGPW